MWGKGKGMVKNKQGVKMDRPTEAIEELKSYVEEGGRPLMVQEVLRYIDYLENKRQNKK